MSSTVSYILSPEEQVRAIVVKKDLAALFQKNPNISTWTREECEFVKKQDVDVMKRSRPFTMWRSHDSRAAEETISVLFPYDPLSFNREAYADKLATFATMPRGRMSVLDRGNDCELTDIISDVADLPGLAACYWRLQGKHTEGRAQKTSLQIEKLDVVMKLQRIYFSGRVSRSKGTEAGPSTAVADYLFEHHPHGTECMFTSSDHLRKTLNNLYNSHKNKLPHHATSGDGVYDALVAAPAEVSGLAEVVVEEDEPEDEQWYTIRQLEKVIEFKLGAECRVLYDDNIWYNPIHCLQSCYSPSLSSARCLCKYAYIHT
jgi:hypothetical protein